MSHPAKTTGNDDYREENSTESAAKQKNNSTQHSSTTANELLPKDSKQKNILEKRAIELAAITAESIADNIEKEEYIRFKLGKNEHYGIPYRYLEEITYSNKISQIPCVPDHIAGVINWRGNLLAVLNIAVFFNIKMNEINDESRVIIVTANNLTAGILVNQIEENNTYPTNMLDPPISSDGVTNLDYVKGIYQGAITIIDLTAIFNDRTLEVNQ